MMYVHRSEDEVGDLYDLAERCEEDVTLKDLNSVEEERYKRMKSICTGCIRLRPGIVYLNPKGSLPCAYDGNEYAFDRILRNNACPMNPATLVVTKEKQVNPLKASRRKAKGK